MRFHLFLILFLLVLSNEFAAAQEKAIINSKALDQSTELLLLPSKSSNKGSDLVTPERYQRKKLPQKKVKATESTVSKENTSNISSEVSVVLMPSSRQKPVNEKEEIKDLSKTYASPDLKSSDKKEISNSLFSDLKPKSLGSSPPQLSLQPEVLPGVAQGMSVPQEGVATSASGTISQPAALNSNVPSSSEPSGETVIENETFLLPGTDSDKIQAYVEQIHPDDVRLNRAELNIASGLIMNDARSNYSYRQYSTSSPHITFKGTFWLSPFMSLYGSYLNSVGSDMTANPANNSKIVAQHELTEFGLDLRKHYGLSRKSNSLSYGIFFSEYKLTVPGDSQYRVKLRSSGIGFKVGARLPVSPNYSWTIGGQLVPRVQTIETATALNLSSGSLGESSRFGINFGGEIKLTRFNQIYWILDGIVEKNQFNGQASVSDPETGVAPRGVGVDNRFLILSFGYRWGQ